MKTLELVASSLGIFLLLLALNSIATAMLVVSQMVISKMTDQKKVIND